MNTENVYDIRHILILTPVLCFMSKFRFTGSALKSSASNDASMTMATGMGVNGFGRIGRLVTRIMMEDDSVDLTAINAGSATPDYMAYQYKYDTIHGKAKQTVDVDGDFLVLNGKKIQTSR